MSNSSNAPFVETTTAVKHYTDRLFKFRLTRPSSFRFRSGEFVMVGLKSDTGKPILRAYSICSPAWDDQLEFFSIKVADGPLTSRLQNIQIGDEVILGRKPTGTLVLDALKPGKRLYMLSTGTGFAPFASLLRDPETYEKFENIYVFHGTRLAAEATYSAETIEELNRDELIGSFAAGKVQYLASTTQETSPCMGRVTDMIQNGDLFQRLAAPAFDREHDRVMICGSMAMIQDTKSLCEEAGLQEGSNASPADFVIEKAFAA